jgi:hypothetical protein
MTGNHDRPALGADAEWLEISIMLEELGVPYTVIPVNIRAGDQRRWRGGSEID